MADINLNFGTEDLKGLRQLLHDIQKAVESIYKASIATGQVVMNDDLRAKALLATEMKIANEIRKQEQTAQKLNDTTRVQAGIIGGLEQEVKDYTRAWKAAIDTATKNNLKRELDTIKAKLEDVKGSTNTWGKALDSFQFKFNALGNVAANVLSRVKTYMIDFVKDSIKMAAATEGVKNAFDKLNQPGLLDKMRKATRDTVNDLSLMKTAVLANDFRIPLDQLVVFLKFAGNQALRTGQDFDYLVESIIRGLGRESVLVLDNLGLSAKAVQEEAKKTGSFFEGAANVIIKSMEDAGDVTDTAVVAFARLNVEVDKLKVSVGNQLNPTLTTTADIAAGILSDVNKSEMGLIEYFSGPLLKGVIAYNKAFLDLIKNKKELEENFLWEESEQPEKAAEEIAKINDKLQDVTVSLSDIDKHSDVILGLAPKDEDIEKWNKYFESIYGGVVNLEKWMVDIQKEIGEDFTKMATENVKKSADDNTDYVIRKLEQEAEAEKQIQDQKNAIKREAWNTAYALGNALASINNSRMQEELANTNLTEAQKLEIKKKYAKKDQAIAISMALINVAEGVTKALTMKPPLGFIYGALIAAQGVAQIAAIKAQKFAKGGEIGGKSHSQGGTMIEAEKGEFVIRKSAYQKNKELINAINAEDSVRIAMALRQDKKIETRKDYTKDLLEYMKSLPVYGETKEFYVVHNGNKIIKIHK